MYYVCQEQYGPRAEYLRYTDDQIIMAKSIDDARMILVESAKNLHEIGLNIVAAKVKEFSKREDFDYYWTFELMDMLGDESNNQMINLAAKIFNEQRRSDLENSSARPWRWWSVERRILKLGLARIDEPIRTEIASRLLSQQAVEGMDEFMFAAVARGLKEEERVIFFRIIDECVPRVPFNSFHLNLRRFFTNYEKPWRDLAEIDRRIEELNSFWDPGEAPSLAYM
jgi:hypothetical protein